MKFSTLLKSLAFCAACGNVTHIAAEEVASEPTPAVAHVHTAECGSDCTEDCTTTETPAA